jgi:uncharacterized protein DUF1203
MGFVLRGADVDVTGGRRVLVTEAGVAPCRRCLHDVEPGEEAILVSYDPFRVDSPYRGASPVFVHAEPCPRYEGSDVPAQQRRRLLSARSYDTDAMMLDADVVDGTELEPLLERLFKDPRASFVHVHNARPGCFAVRVDRG